MWLLMTDIMEKKVKLSASASETAEEKTRMQSAGDSAKLWQTLRCWCAVTGTTPSLIVLWYLYLYFMIYVLYIYYFL